MIEIPLASSLPALRPSRFHSVPHDRLAMLTPEGIANAKRHFSPRQREWYECRARIAGSALNSTKDSARPGVALSMSIIRHYLRWLGHDAGGALPPEDVLAGIL